MQPNFPCLATLLLAAKMPHFFSQGLGFLAHEEEKAVGVLERMLL
jgi:hypothetical protein